MRPISRHRLVAGASIMALMGSLAVLSANAGALTSARPGDRAARRPVPIGNRRSVVDRNGDRITDILAHRLTTAKPGKRFDVVVTFQSRAELRNATTSMAGVAAHVHRTFGLIPGFDASLTARQVHALSHRSGLIRVEQDFTVHALDDPADNDFGTAAARSAFSTTGAGTEVCIIDTGVDPNHEQLDSKGTIPFIDYTTSNHNVPAYDDNGHGTHVASIAVGDGTGGPNAAAYNGVAPGAALSVAKVLDASGSGDDSLAVLGIQWCAARPSVNVISMSLGSDVSSDGQDAISLAVDAAVENHGKVVVAAAGNSGDVSGSIMSPGAADDAIAVGAATGWSGSQGGPYLAPFSSRGPTADGRIKPDVVAPGINITAAQAGTTNGYIAESGTSMATPFVAGTALLIMSKQPTWSPAQVQADIEGTAHDVGAPGKDNEWGAGLIDGYAAVAQAAGSSGAAPFPTLHPRITGSLSSSDVFVTTFTLSQADLGTPIAATITTDGVPSCQIDLGPPFGCLFWGIDPDLDVALFNPSNQIVTQSTCPSGDNCVSGRQETLSYMPTVAGTYTIEVQRFSGSGGSFSIDLFTGPVGGPASSPSPTPTASPSASASPTGSPSPSVSASPSTSPSPSASPSPSTSASPSVSPTPTPTPTPTPSPSSSSSPPPAPTVHVGDLDDVSVTISTGWRAQVRIRVVDQAGHAVQGAVVRGKWPNGTTASCTTNASGLCTIKRNLAKTKASIVFTVTSVASSLGSYRPADNTDPDGDSNGTKITLHRP